MLKIEKKSMCCGCEACVQVCPMHCIEMTEDNEGFKYPNIDIDKCVNCNACEKICPIRNSVKKNDMIKNSYVAYSQNFDIRKNSSSGGIFSEFAIAILNDNGVVFGASFNDKFEVNHILIDSKKDLHQLQGSKYVQSAINKTYIEAKKQLKQGKKVLFTGTPCQISGLKSFLGKDYKNLFTIDILCHGVPSQKVWRKYIIEKEHKYNSRIQSCNFRSKENGWKLYSMELLFTNSDVYVQNYQNDSFMKLFLCNICLRPSCYDCKFKSLSRDSDITIGDCWGIENFLPEMHDDNGTSVVIIHSDKGQELFNLINNGLKYCKVDIDIALPKSRDSRKSVKSHRNRKNFFDKIDSCSIDELLKLSAPGFKDKLYWKMSGLLKNS